MTQGSSVAVQAGAKVNPLLQVHGRRSDGYHELSTLMLGLDLHDRVVVTLRESGAVSVTSTGPFATPDISTDATNLAARGAEVAMGALGRSASVSIALHKQVPSRAGLGGGSSDAAAAALATLELLRPGWEGSEGGAPQELEEAVVRGLGAMGADCAFFFAARNHGAASSTGRGERVEPLVATPPWHVALLTPAIACATPAVYGALDLPLLPAGFDSGEAGRAKAKDLLGTAARQARELLFNDLEEPAFRTFPALQEWRGLFEESGFGHFRLAGSGSSFFGLFDDAGSAEAALAELRASASQRDLGLRLACVARPSADRLLHVEPGGPA